MRIFENCKEAYPEILRDIVKFGIIVKSKTQQDKDVSQTDLWWSKEIQAYTFSVANDADCISEAKDPQWVTDEIHERTNTKFPWINPGVNMLKRDYWKDYVWVNPLSGEGRYPYSYNERMGPYLNDLVKHLSFNLDSRQAILVLWRQDIDIYGIGGNFRVPCSITYHFMVRENKVDLIYHMRSCDYFEHFRNDFALATLLKRWMADALNLENNWSLGYGKTIMMIDSLHAYKKDLPEDLKIF